MTELPAARAISFTFAITGIAGALLILLHFLHRNGFWIDELYTLHAIRLPWADMVLERLKRGHFPGYFLLLKLVYQPLLAFNTETVLRSFSIVCWLAAVASYVPLARRFVAPGAVAVSILLLGLNGVIIRQAGEARMYTLVLLLAVWMTRSYLEMLHAQNTRKWGLLLAVFTALGFAVSATVSMLSMGLLYDALRRRRQQPFLVKPVVLALFVGAIVFIPGAVLHLKTSDRLGIAGVRPIELLEHLVSTFAGVQVRDDYFHPTRLLHALQIIGALVTAALLARLWCVRRLLPDQCKAGMRIVFVPFVLMIVTEVTSKFLNFSLLGPPRYLVSIFPAAAVLVGFLVSPLMHRRLTAILLHAALSAFLLVNAYAVQIVETEAFRERVRIMHAEWFRPGDAVVAVPAEIADGVELYAPGVKVDAAIDRWELDPQVLARQLAPLRSRPRVLLVYYRGRNTPVLHVAEALFGPATSDRPDKPMGTLRVFRFRPELAGIEDQ
ncbi:MAG: hypothetical protein ACR2IE_13745 [Candidatus Sumerlaeaceae bacterium]